MANRDMAIGHRLTLTRMMTNVRLSAFRHWNVDWSTGSLTSMPYTVLSNAAAWLTRAATTTKAVATTATLEFAERTIPFSQTRETK